METQTKEFNLTEYKRSLTERIAEHFKAKEAELQLKREELQQAKEQQENNNYIFYTE